MQMIRSQCLRSLPWPASLWGQCQVLSKAIEPACFCSPFSACSRALSRSRWAFLRFQPPNLLPWASLKLELPQCSSTSFDQLLIYPSGLSLHVSLPQGGPLCPSDQASPFLYVPTVSLAYLWPLSVVVYNTWFTPCWAVSPSRAGALLSCPLLYCWYLECVWHSVGTFNENVLID